MSKRYKTVQFWHFCQNGTVLFWHFCQNGTVLYRLDIFFCQKKTFLDIFRRKRHLVAHVSILKAIPFWQKCQNGTFCIQELYETEKLSLDQLDFTYVLSNKERQSIIIHYHIKLCLQCSLNHGYWSICVKTVQFIHLDIFLCQNGIKRDTSKKL